MIVFRRTWYKHGTIKDVFRTNVTAVAALRIAVEATSLPACDRRACTKTALFWSFPYVCPEPVLVKQCILYINGAKSAVFSPGLAREWSSAWYFPAEHAFPLNISRTLTFVPSLSWETVGLFYSSSTKRRQQKKTFVSAPVSSSQMNGSSALQLVSGFAQRGASTL
jgi:hypothetical protein